MATLPAPATGVARAEDTFTSEGAPAPGMVQSTQTPVEATAPGGSADAAGQRTEHDALGAVEVPAHALWGAQTQRALHHFPPAGEPMPRQIIMALALVKRSAARVNAALGMLDAPHADAIVRAADEVLVGDHPHAFPLSVWQSGSGTQTHMNMNEVLANRASELLGGGRGDARTVHPNDHVNLGQSSNDVVPTALHLAVLTTCRDALLPVLAGLRDTLAAQALACADVVKTGRTHLQDAVPLTLGQEMGAWAAQLDQAHASLLRQLEPVHALAIGGTAVGTGLNAHPQFGAQMVQALAEVTGLPLRRADHPFAAQAAHDALVDLHGALRTLAVALTKIANDVRWLASGPRCGLGELVLPANEPGSSVMPGKVNPSQCEALLMIAAQVMGNDVAVGIAGCAGQFQLNTAKPLLAHNLLQSIRLLADGMRGFDRFCAQGLQPDRARIAAQLSQSLMLVTALVPHLGHDRAAALALHAQSVGCTLRDAALASGEVTAEQFDAWVVPQDMVGSIDPTAQAAT